MKRVRTISESFSSFMCLVLTFVIFATSATFFNAESITPAHVFALCIALLLIIAMLLIIRWKFALRHFKKNSICYSANIIDWVDCGYSVRNGQLGPGRRVANAICEFTDADGKMHVITSNRSYPALRREYQWRDGSFKRVEQTEIFSANIYICRSNPKKFEIEIYRFK